jgi:pSer/pThr/pTyr-binding forkhead associated (FHA) protein
MAYLTIEFPDGKETRIMLLKELIVIGRGPEVDICIDAEWVSGVHARLALDGSDYFIEDLGSSNGTFINYSRIEKAALKDNDLIFLGRTKILFRNAVGDLEESAVELDILDDEQSGVFTKAPPPCEVKMKRSEIPTTDDVAELLKAYETSDKIPIGAFQKEGLSGFEPNINDLKRALREANLRSATLQIELDAQRKRAEQEIEFLMKEVNSWKSRYFDRVNEAKKLKQEMHPEGGSKTKKFDENLIVKEDPSASKSDDPEEAPASD